jgi:uncharacterized membrane protein YvlD (DUF360 family)
MRYHKQHSRRQEIVRILVIWLITALALGILSRIMRGVYVEPGTAIVGAAVIGIVNAILYPILSRLLLPFTVFTLGLLSLVINGALILIASDLLESFQVDSLWDAVILSIALAALNAIFSGLLNIDDDSSYFRNTVRRQMKRRYKPVETDVPGFLFLEIDGLSRPVLEMAMERGYAPTMKRWRDDGSHHLVQWETDTSSQTSASQTGLLHGNNWNVPAFRWYDKKNKLIMVSSKPDIVAAMEKERSDGKGLLIDQGVSRNNMFSGDAPEVQFTASTLKDFSRLRTSSFQAYFANPYNFSRTLLLFFWELILEYWEAWQQKRHHVEPHGHRGGVYPLMRAVMTIIFREMTVYTLIGDMYAGVPAAYATFVGYDEVAHHSGVETEDALKVLYKLDQQFARLEKVTADSPRPYHLIILSDHGQSKGATFLQRYGLSLEDLVKKLSRVTVTGIMDSDETWSRVNSMLTDAIHEPGNMVSGVVKRAVGGRTDNGTVALGPQEEQQAEEAEAATSDIIVMGSGNLGLIYFTRFGERLTLEQMNDYYPGVIPGLIEHPGVGFIMVNSTAKGPLAIGAQGVCYLGDGRIEGENPLANFGPNAARHLYRTHQFPDCPDILANSFYDPVKDEGCAFEELIGFHGGMGGNQTKPFILYPASLPGPTEPLIGAAAVHHMMKGWLAAVHSEQLAVNSKQ